MHTGTRRSLSWTLFVVLIILVGVAMAGTPVFAQTAKLSAPTVVDTSLGPGSAFSIDISITNVENLWGYEFWLFYNTTLLTATDFSSYDPFTNPWMTRINDTAGYVYLSYSMPAGTEEGFSTTDVAPIMKVDFTVDALGTSSLSLKGTKLSTPKAKPIAHEPYDGFFANVEMLTHDIAITNIVAPTTVEIDETVTVTVTVENQGDSSETFNVSLYYDTTLFETETNVTLSDGASTTLTFTWDTTGVAEGTYTIKATASVVPDEVETVDNTDTRTITITEEEPTPPDYTMVAVAAVAIVVIIAVVVYALKVRKPKAT